MTSRLVLHFDVNETIMVGDPAGGVSFEQCLNIIVAKSAAVRAATTTDDGADESDGSTAASGSGRWSEWVWHDGSPLDPELRSATAAAPELLPVWELPTGCSSCYRSMPRDISRVFTEPSSPGAIYRPVYEQLELALRCPPEVAADSRLCHDGVHHFLLPAFFETLTALRELGRPLSIVIRTFGTDAPAVADAVAAYAEGALSLPGVDPTGAGGGQRHPPWPELAAAAAGCERWAGRYRAADRCGEPSPPPPFTLQPCVHVSLLLSC